MKRWLALAVVAAMLAVPVVSAASWTQAGYDAARTSHAPFVGPADDDVALQMRMPGFVSDDFIRAPMGPLVHDGSAYVHVRALGSDEGAEALGLDLHGVVKVDLDTGERERFVEVEDQDPWRRVAGMGTDGERLYLSTFNWPGFERLEAYRLSDGELVWTWEPPDVHGSSETPTRQTWLAGCAQPAVVDGTVYHWCNQRQSDGDQNLDPGDRVDGVLAAIDATTGEEEWRWTTQSDAWRTHALEEPNPRGVRLNTEFAGIAAVGDFVVATAFSLKGGGGDVGCADEILPCTRAGAGDGNLSLVALDRSEGTFAWAHGVEAVGAGAGAADRGAGVGNPTGGASVHPTGDSGEVYVRILDRVLKLNPHREDNRVIWSQPIGEEDARTAFTLGGFALDEEAVYTTSSQTVYRFGRENPSNQWRTSLDPDRDELFLWGGVSVSEDTLYAAASRLDDGSTNGTALYAMDKATGEILWRHVIAYDPAVEEHKSWNQNHYHSIADGKIVVGGGDASLRVIGETEASLVPRANLSTAYPAADEEVTVDLSGTEPGVQGAASAYKAVWGDETETGWQADPVLEHAYAENGDVEARMIARNDANQTSSTYVTFHVGQEAPTEPNWLSERFEPENQEMTFGVIGIAMALGGGAIGVARRQRKRSNLEDELETLEQGFEETRDQPSECEAFLDTRKARARSLALDGYLREDQVPVVENRAEELRGQLRQSALEEEFAFLPYGLVTKARQMVQDGDVTALEKDAFLQAIEEDEVLTSEQKTTVRERIQRWHGRDAGGGQQ